MFKQKVKFLLLAHTIALVASCGGTDSDYAEVANEEIEFEQIESLYEPGTWVNPPGNGVQTGYDGGPEGVKVVCRANYDGGQHPGKVWEGRCNYGWGGKARRDANYKVLLSNGYRWKNPLVTVSCSGSTCIYDAPLPQNAVDGGESGYASGNVRMGICQALWGGNWHPGKYFKKKCNIALGGTNANPTGGDSEEKVLAPNVFGEVLVLVK